MAKAKDTERVTSREKVKVKGSAKDMAKEKVKAKASQALARATPVPSKGIVITAGSMDTESQTAHSLAKVGVLTWCRILGAIQHTTMRITVHSW